MDIASSQGRKSARVGCQQRADSAAMLQRDETTVWSLQRQAERSKNSRAQIKRADEWDRRDAPPDGGQMKASKPSEPAAVVPADGVTCRTPAPGQKSR
jgi:hypothetical protein